MTSTLLLVLAVLQGGGWLPLGTTSTGNAVSAQQSSIRTVDGVIHATVRVIYAKPVATPKGPLGGAVTKAMFDCAKNAVATKETTLYHDVAAGKVYAKSVVKQPGFGPQMKGTFAQVALEGLCGRAARADGRR